MAQTSDTLPVSITDQASRLAPQLKALADETRLTLMLLLAERPRSVRELTEATGLSQTLVSHHLTPLREQNLIVATPRGRANIYSVCCDEVAVPVRMLAGLTRPASDEDCACD
ncbi:regulatory ArsR family protein [Stackebrandtia albiflava]|uniref:Regulatory ArsR family protein n=1 Tax=Stackebrandtia albiflava TaxID=406432 RepID=A0A562V9E7_9ACTN|nr:metalloregulator ArsR/SmtB family transcription factor [Stackebrandtia albiflava]TWJ14501.1 regulatory ArsR family protein [Stackebrandtia albiflava]